MYNVTVVQEVDDCADTTPLTVPTASSGSIDRIATVIVPRNIVKGVQSNVKDRHRRELSHRRFTQQKSMQKNNQCSRHARHDQGYMQALEEAGQTCRHTSWTSSCIQIRRAWPGRRLHHDLHADMAMRKSSASATRRGAIECMHDAETFEDTLA